MSLFYNQPKNNLKLTNNYCYKKFINKKKKSIALNTTKKIQLFGCVSKNAQKNIFNCLRLEREEGLKGERKREEEAEIDVEGLRLSAMVLCLCFNSFDILFVIFCKGF